MPTVCPPDERRRAVLILRVLSSIIVGRHHLLTTALARADMARDDAVGALNEALADAGLELDRLPALDRRHLLCSYAKHAGLEPVDRQRRGSYQQRAAKPAMAGAA